MPQSPHLPLALMLFMPNKHIAPDPFVCKRRHLYIWTQGQRRCGKLEGQERNPQL
jgi:hypothetical protein